MKKTLALILAVLMLISLLPVALAEAPADTSGEAAEIPAEATAETPAAAEAKRDELEERAFPLYLWSPQASGEELSLHFINGVEDLPYLDLTTGLSLLYEIISLVSQNPDYDLEIETEGSVVTVTRENGYNMVLDVDRDTVYFNDFNGFLQGEKDATLIDILTYSGFNDDGVESLFQRDLQASFDRYGDEKTIDLASYHIDLFMQDEECYIPLQTFSDLLLYPVLGSGFLFNGEAVILASGGMMVDEDTGELTELGQLYYDVKPAALSEELAEYNYNELCMAFDCLYGLKETHDIRNFHQTFWEIAFDEVLSETDPYDADLALHQFINYYLDDQHSSFIAPSPRAGAESMGKHGVHAGTATARMDEHMERYAETREKAYPDGYKPYEEVGNTAYVTFDQFTMAFDAEDYYAFADGEEPLQDTLGLIIYAHRQITRPDSPIENVVVDLSNNIGGNANAAVYVISWLLGDAPFSMKDTFTGAMSNAIYRADVNLDRKFDEADTVIDKNVYCLISPVSFSCGNLVPAALKASQKVTLLGTKSGGGSCVVQPLSTAAGTLFNISGPHRLSFLKNGSFYDIDQGIDPDIAINNMANYYDRVTLTEFINGLF